MIYLITTLITALNIYSVFINSAVYASNEIWINLLNIAFLLILIGMLWFRKQVNTLYLVFYSIIILTQVFFVIYPQYLLSINMISKCQNITIYSIRDTFTGKTALYKNNTGQIGSISNNGVDGDELRVYNIYATQDVFRCLKDKNVKIEYIE